MARTRTTLIVTVAALFGGLAASAALDARPVFAKDTPKDTAKDAKDAAKDAQDAAALKKKRDDFRAARKKEGKLPFLDLSYAADPVAIKDTRWTQTDPPHPQAKEETGTQLSAGWSASTTQPGGISVVVNKYIHKSLDGKSEFTFNFEKAGITCKTADKAKMAEGFFMDWKKELKADDAKCTPPKDSNVGPADTYASVAGTDPVAQKRTRKDLYVWTGPNTTWVALVEFSDRFVDDKDILAKAAAFIGSFKKLKAPD